MRDPIKLDPFFEVRTPDRNFGPARLSGGVTVTPLARRLAAESGIDLSRLSGSGPHGRIVARDIETAPRPADAPLTARAGPSADEVKALFAPDAYEEVPLDGMRRTIAARLTQAIQTIPHFYLTADVEIDRLIKLREEANLGAPKDKDGGPAFKLSLNDFIIRALALALQRVPAANAAWAGDRILRFKHSDIGVAVALDGGLITPVIRSAETKSISAISAEMKDSLRPRPRQEAQAGGLPGRLGGDLQSRHVRRARVLGHHQSAARHDPRGRRRAPAGGRKAGRRRCLRELPRRHAVLRPSRARRRAGSATALVLQDFYGAPSNHARVISNWILYYFFRAPPQPVSRAPGQPVVRRVMFSSSYLRAPLFFTGRFFAFCFSCHCLTLHFLASTSYSGRN